MAIIGLRGRLAASIDEIAREIKGQGTEMVDEHNRISRVKSAVIHGKIDLADSAREHARASRERHVKAGKMTDNRKAIDAGGSTGKFSNIRGQVPDEWWMQPEADRERLLELDRLANLGLLTVGLAHEILNPLSAVLNLNMLVRQMLSAETHSLERIGEMRKHLGDAASEVSRVCRLISELRAFAQTSGTRKEVLDLNRIVESALSLASHKLKLENVQVGTQLSSQLPWVLGNRVQLQHLVLDIIQKCVQGRQNDRIEIITEVQNPGGKVLLEVRHGGERISPEHSARPCEPYPVADGSSYSSLPVARYISQAHGGDILIDSMSGGGSAYRVVLPIADLKDVKSPGQK